jgi:hypothetical protein
MTENQRQELIALITLVHEEAQAGYWATNNDCGGDYRKPNCEPCNHSRQCDLQERIDIMLKKMKGG